jgi:hypothetical protein
MSTQPVFNAPSSKRFPGVELFLISGVTAVALDHAGANSSSTNQFLKGQAMSNDGKNGLQKKPGSDSEAAPLAPEHKPFEKTVDQAIQNHLGRKLKATYDDLVQQPVPDKFRQLLDELERQETKQ